MTILDRKRLIADTGKLIQKGYIQVKVADVTPDDIENWSEIDDPNYASHIPAGSGAE